MCGHGEIMPAAPFLIPAPAAALVPPTRSLLPPAPSPQARSSRIEHFQRHLHAKNGAECILATP